MDLFPDLAIEPAPRASAQPAPHEKLSKKELERRRYWLRKLQNAPIGRAPKRYTAAVHALVEAILDSRFKLPKQKKLEIRWRNKAATGPIERRVHEVAGNREFEDLTTVKAIRLQMKLFEDSILRLTEGQLTDNDVSETWAWIDREHDVANPFDYTACLQAYADHVGRDYDWIRDGVERLRPDWLRDHATKPKAYALYWMAVVLG